SHCVLSTTRNRVSASGFPNRVWQPGQAGSQTEFGNQGTRETTREPGNQGNLPLAGRLQTCPTGWSGSTKQSPGYLSSCLPFCFLLGAHRASSPLVVASGRERHTV